MDRALGDIEEIKRLKARYFRHLDRKEWDDLGMVFAPDAHIDTDGFTQTGRDEIIAFLARVLAGTSTVHHGHMPEIDVDGDAARGVWSMEDYVEFLQPDGTPHEPAKGLRGYGHYEEEYRRDGGTWRIANLRLVRLRVDLLPGGLPDDLPT